MPMFTSKSRLYDVLKDPTGQRIITSDVPDLANNPLLHTFFLYEVGLILDTEGSLQGNPDKKAEILAKIEAIEPGKRGRGQVVHEVAPSQDYEPAETVQGSAAISHADMCATWERFEIELSGPEHGNPFTDVVLEARFSTNGKILTVPGFYDGAGTYRIRVLVPTAGDWTFRTTSNARSLDGIMGSFTAVPEGRSPGPVRVADGFHFAYDNGTPYVPIGTTCYAWTHQGDELEEQTLATLAAAPFNKMRMCVFPKSYLYNENEPEFYPYEGSLTAGFDFTRPNPAYYRHLEKRVAQLQTLGIEADLILFHAYDRWGFSTMDRAADDLFVKYLVARLASHPNVWWSLANEYDLLSHKDIEDWERFAALVQANDPTGHLMSIHNCGEFYDYSRPWVSHCSMQRSDVAMTTEWRQMYRKPVVIDECGYEGNVDMSWGNITGEEMLHRFWEAAVRGGYASHGETYVNPEETLWWSKGGQLEGTSPQRIGFLHRLIQECPTGHLEPLAGEFPTGGVRDEYEISYFGYHQPSFRRFIKAPGTRFHVDVIDTWNMTVETLPDTFEGRFRVELPARSFMALRLRATHDGT